MSKVTLMNHVSSLAEVCETIPKLTRQKKSFDEMTILNWKYWKRQKREIWKKNTKQQTKKIKKGVNTLRNILETKSMKPTAEFVCWNV